MATYKTLAASLDWPTGQPPSQTTTLICSSLSAPGDILLPHFLSSDHAVLLSFTQTSNHYMHILRKMGVHRPKIHFVNALTDFSLDALPSATRPKLTVNGDWPRFYQWLAGQPENTTLVVDGLCSLMDQGMSAAQAAGVFDTCRRITELLGGRLVVSVFLDEFTEKLVRALVRRSHYVFNFEGLASGASSDVSGQLTAVPGHLNCQTAKAFKPVHLHYKVADTAVQFFSPGQSRTVL
ncbi:Elongator subunit elp6 [Linderina pennispora]|nr:Elongator subunit elp6 [Linderina pennispora]